MDDKEKETENFATISRNVGLIIAGLILVCIFVPVFIDFVFSYNIPTSDGLERKDWLGFYGGFLGGIIGGIATLLAVYFTIKHAENDCNDTARKLDLQKFEEIKPKLMLWIESESFNGDGLEMYTVQILNVGNAHALNAKVQNSLLRVIYPNVKERVFIYPKKESTTGHLKELKVYFEDYLGTKYSQIYFLHQIEVNNDNGGSGMKMEKYYSLDCHN